MSAVSSSPLCSACETINTGCAALDVDNASPDILAEAAALQAKQLLSDSMADRVLVVQQDGNYASMASQI